MIRAAARARSDHEMGGGFELDVVGEEPLVGARPRSANVLVGEERDLVPGGGLPRCEVQHVALRAPASVQELVDVQDPHARAASDAGAGDHTIARATIVTKYQRITSCVITFAVRLRRSRPANEAANATARPREIPGGARRSVDRACASPV